jgi:hypothetical protein
MSRENRGHAEAQAVVLTRMAATRNELLSRRKPTYAVRVIPKPRVAADAGPWVLRTPNAALIAVLLVGAVVLGPRRALQTALQSALHTGLSVWTSRIASAFTGER